MHRYLLLVFLFLLCSFQVSVLTFTDMHVMKAAEGQLGVFTSRIPPGEASSYGFRQEDDLEALAVGKPYRILEFNEDFYHTQIEEDHNYVIIRNEWRVPVSSKGLNRVMLNVRGNPGNYTVAGMGDTLLARELQHTGSGANDSDEYYLLRIPALGAMFFGYEHTGSFGDAEFIPLSSAIASIDAIGKSRHDSYKLAEVQQLVKDELAHRNTKEPTVAPTLQPKKIVKKKRKPLPAKTTAMPPAGK